MEKEQPAFKDWYTEDLWSFIGKKKHQLNGRTKQSIEFSTTTVSLSGRLFYGDNVGDGKKRYCVMSAYL